MQLSIATSATCEYDINTVPAVVFTICIALRFCPHPRHNSTATPISITNLTSTMAPTILVVGSTGNTGRSVVETLSEQLKTSDFAGHRIIALTRSSKGGTAQKLAKLPDVEVIEKNWVDITQDWLREHEVARAFIASHNEPQHFADESAFHLAALQSGVKYVVRISTTAANVRPDCDVYYPRQHWAVEALLGSPEFKALQWSSLQPNVFSTFTMAPAVGFIKNYRETGKQEKLRLMLSEDAPVGVIHPDDVGIFAAKLLLEKDTTKHNNMKYVLNGPEDITGKQTVELVEKQIGAKVEHVIYKDLSFVDEMAKAAPGVAHLILTIKRAPNTAWEGACTASTTSEEVLKLAPPQHRPAAVLQSLLDG